MVLHYLLVSANAVDSLFCVTTTHATTTHELLNGLFSLWIH